MYELVAVIYLVVSALLLVATSIVGIRLGYAKKLTEQAFAKTLIILRYFFYLGIGFVTYVLSVYIVNRANNGTNINTHAIVPFAVILTVIVTGVAFFYGESVFGHFAQVVFKDIPHQKKNTDELNESDYIDANGTTILIEYRHRIRNVFDRADAQLVHRVNSEITKLGVNLNAPAQWAILSRAITEVGKNNPRLAIKTARMVDFIHKNSDTESADHINESVQKYQGNQSLERLIEPDKTIQTYESVNRLVEDNGIMVVSKGLPQWLAYREAVPVLLNWTNKLNNK